MLGHSALFWLVVPLNSTAGDSGLLKSKGTAGADEDLREPSNKMLSVCCYCVLDYFPMIVLAVWVTCLRHNHDSYGQTNGFLFVRLISGS